MALEIRDITFSRRPEIHRFLVESAEVITKGELVGVHDGTGSGTKGEVEDYNDGVSGLRFLGVNIGDTVTGDGSTVYCNVDLTGLAVSKCTVTGSASSKPLDLVYALTADPLDGLTMTAPDGTTAPVGVLLEQLDGSTSWRVQLFPADVAVLALADALRPVGKIGTSTTYTANGAITLPTEDNEAARLTGASSAAMTLAVPTAAIVGYTFTVYRSAGTGTHDVDYTDAAGNAQTFTFSATGNSVTLLAESTTGWRPLS